MREINERTRNGKGILIALLILLLAGSWSMWLQAQGQERQEQAGEKDPASTVLLHDLDTLWKWADPLLAGGAASAAWSARWDAHGSEEQAQQLGVLMSLPELYYSDSDVGHAYRELSGGTVKLWVQPQGAMVLLFEGFAGSSGETLRAALEQIERDLKRMDLQAEPSLSFRGTAAAGEVSAKLAEQASAGLIEQYEDEATLSSTYYTPKLKLHTRSGAKLVNLQLAVHRETGTGIRQFTGGIPLITGEYVRPTSAQELVLDALQAD